jgi:hypothetical protein
VSLPELTVVCWKWRTPIGYRSKFDAKSVNVLRAMVARHYARPHRFVCITDDAKGIDGDVRVVPIWNDFAHLRGPNGVNCYRRLRAFSAEAGDLIGPRFVSLDLDCVITADVSPLWDRPEDFVIWGDTARGTPYNGSMFLLTAGARRQVWERFDPEHSPAYAKRLGYIGSDQAWIGACLGLHERKWSKADGVYSFRNEIHGKRRDLPLGARVVMFHGRFDPWMPAVQAQHRWIKEHWRG